MSHVFCKRLTQKINFFSRRRSLSLNLKEKNVVYIYSHAYFLNWKKENFTLRIKKQMDSEESSTLKIQSKSSKEVMATYNL